MTASRQTRCQRKKSWQVDACAKTWNSLARAISAKAVGLEVGRQAVRYNGRAFRARQATARSSPIDLRAERCAKPEPPPHRGVQIGVAFGM
jgi:hypothetical protein